MWCTRWYLPLLFLPFSRASPLFLLAFIFSVTLQAKPCLYCVILLGALAQGSCYWQPVPAQELLSSLNLPINSTITLESLPSTGRVRLLNRCWCDITPTKFFLPFDVREWELKSLQREAEIRAADEKKKREVIEAEEKRIADEEAEALREDIDVEEHPNDPLQESIQQEESPAVEEYPETFMHSSGILPTSSSRWRSYASKRVKAVVAGVSILKWNSSNSTTPSPSSSPIPSPPEISSPPSPIIDIAPLPIFRRQYDLRPHGVGIVLDFGWGRSSS